ncbi:periplasmic repressor CpxP [Marinomonas ushuaiensis DSM 15871]|uniref:Periplasmic repressor CpxP n=1 Tax=Marinomonas ushuaiensis DSM 15871 TaxID=1122207 RepID=X7E2V0_9GAMM|nr:CpxP family protein [Marinomonas ushuaiensis]ETX10282.1 periplasmic repressor CpxP [Marinomonas ushuaiensis DSM 15871]
MKMTKKLIIASVVLPLVLSTGSAFAFGGKDNKGHKGECRVGMDRGIMKQLELTDIQKEQFKTLRKATKEERKNKGKDKPEQHQAKRLADFEKVNSLLLADKFDPAKATEIAQKMAQKQIKRQVSLLNNQYQMISILTPEQKTKFVELQKERLNDCAEKRADRHDK